MNDKLVLWLYDISSNWQKPQWIRNLAEIFLPRCEYRHWKTHAVCNQPGTPCWLPNWNDEPEEAIQWICYEHVVDAGFCCSCHQFSAGVESFEFGDHAGYCDNCGYELDAEREREKWQDQEDWENEYEVNYP